MVILRGISLVFIGFSLSFLAFSQNFFYKTYAGGPYDVGQGACEIENEEYAITGSTSSINGSSQAFLMLIDSLGNQIWTKGYGGGGSDWGRRVFHRANEGLWIFGYSNSYGAGDFDFSVWKVDNNGEEEWQQSFGTLGWDRLWDVVELPGGDFVLLGETEGVNSLDKDILILRIDDQGNEVWQNQIDNEGDDIAYAAELFDDTTLIVVGEFYENEENVGILLNMHTNGVINNQWTYSTVGPTTFRGVDVYNDEIYVCGSANITSPNYLNAVVLRLDDNYNILNAEIGNTEGEDFGTHILALSDNRVYWTLSTSAPFFNVYVDGLDAIVFRYHREMYYVGPAYNTSGVGHDYLHQIISTTDGGYLVVGICSDDRVNESSGSNILVAKVGPNDESELIADEGADFLAVDEEYLNTIGDYTLFPNPTSNFIYLPKGYEGYDIRVYNSLGVVEPFEMISGKLFLNGLSEGVYFVSFANDSHSTIFKVMKR
jgi:hypothetical protein